MLAVRAVCPGGPEVLQWCTVDRPEPGPGELLVQIAAAGLNRADLLQRRGLYPPPPGASDILGLECAGTVVALGKDVPPQRLGERVMALLSAGGYAEFVAVSERLALPVPSSLDFTAAAAIPEAFLTAHEALFELARVRPGDRVLVHAAASGVGSAAVQLARAAGASVYATAGGPEKCDFVNRLGATCFDRTAVDFELALRDAAGEASVDVVIDLVGASYFERNCRLLAPKGRLVAIGLLGGSKVNLDLGLLLRKRLQLLGLVMRTRDLHDKIALTQRFARNALPWFDSGVLRPLVDRVFSRAELQAAHERLEQNANMGKVVLALS